MLQPVLSLTDLVSQLSDPDNQVRLQAISDIMSRSAERGQAFPSLLALLNDPDQQVANAALKALGKLKDARAVPALVQVSTRHRLSLVRLNALKALVQVDPVKAQPQAQAALHDPAAPMRAAAGVLSAGRSIARW